MRLACATVSLELQGKNDIQNKFSKRRVGLHEQHIGWFVFLDPLFTALIWFGLISFAHYFLHLSLYTCVNLIFLTPSRKMDEKLNQPQTVIHTHTAAQGMLADGGLTKLIPTHTLKHASPRRHTD